MLSRQTSKITASLAINKLKTKKKSSMSIMS